MTRTAHVSYRDNAFWAYDVPGSIFLWFLIQSAEDFLAGDDGHWLAEMIPRWRVSAVITEMAYYADDDWTPEQVDLVLQLCDNAISAIRQHGDFAATDVESWPVLDDQRIFTRGHDPIAAEPVARLGDAFAQLLRGQLPKPPDYHLWFYTLDDNTDKIKKNIP